MKAAVAADTDIDALHRMLRHRCSAVGGAYRTALGLEPDELAEVVRRFLPRMAAGWRAGDCLGRHLRALSGEPGPECCHRRDAGEPDFGGFSRTLLIEEEADLCRLLLNHRSTESAMTVVFARIIARACMEPEHLWICLGLENRDQLSAVLRRHFRPLADRNTSDMRWKKFFYKLLCDIEKVWSCRASACEICAHYGECYAPE